MNRISGKNNETTQKYRVRTRRTKDNVIIHEEFFKGLKSATERFNSIVEPGHTKSIEASHKGNDTYLLITKAAM